MGCGGINVSTSALPLMGARLAFDRGCQAWKVPSVFKDTETRDAVQMQPSTAVRFLEPLLLFGTFAGNGLHCFYC